MVMTLAMLYQIDVKEHQSQLTATARTQSKIIESITKYSILHSGEPTSKSPLEATLDQISSANNTYEGFGETEEFVLAKLSKDGKNIEFIIR